MAVSLAVSTQYTKVTDRHPASQPPHDSKGRPYAYHRAANNVTKNYFAYYVAFKRFCRHANFDLHAFVYLKHIAATKIIKIKKIF